MGIILPQAFAPAIFVFIGALKNGLGDPLAALPLVLVFLFFQRQIIKAIATTGFGGQ